jgi:hypothetical protein
MTIQNKIACKGYYLPVKDFFCIWMSDAKVASFSFALAVVAEYLLIGNLWICESLGN